MSKLAVICTKNPTNVLLQTIENLKSYYSDFDIVIVDSASDNITMLDYIKALHTDIIIEYVRNKNYELGAWYFAINKYSNYDIYMFIQDTLVPTSRCNDLEKSILYENKCFSCHYNAHIMDGGHIEHLREIYRYTKLHFLSVIPDQCVITGAAHSSFIASRQLAQQIMALEEVYINKNISKTKVDSLIAERLVGIILDYLGCNRVDMNQYFSKVNDHRL